MAGTPSTQSNGPLWLTAIGSGLVVAMLLAVLSPRIFGEEGTGWLFTLVAFLVVAGGVLAYGFSKRNSGRAEREAPPH